MASSRRVFSAVLTLVLLSESACAGELVIAEKGRRTAIIRAAGWKQSAWYDWGAHAILERYIPLVTGAKPELFSADAFAALEKSRREAFDVRIWTGRQPEVDRVLGAELEKIDDDGFILRAAGNDVYLAGKFWWGDNWAAHDLLERFAGCRWYGQEAEFWKPEKGTAALFDVIPQAERIVVPADLNVVEEPSYRMRWFRFMPLHAFRLRYRDSFHHAFEQLLPPEKFGAEHPEYFPLVNGKRRVPKTKGEGQQFQPCASNEDVVNIIADAAIGHFKEKPQSGTFSIGMNDSNVFCECARCLALAPATLAAREQRQAYAFFDFYNRIAARVESVYPGKRLGCLAYAGLSVLPAGSIKIHPTIVPYLTRDSAQLFDADQVKEFRETVDAWKSLTHRMGIYEYVYGGGFVVPRLYNRYLLKNIAERYGVGVDGFYAESYPNWGLDGPKYWLLSRLLWNSSQDPAALMDQYCRDLFGAAAPSMRAYFHQLEETWCSQALASPRSNYRWFLDAKQLEVFSPQACDAAWALLEKAEQQADSDKARERVLYFKNTFNLTRTLSRRYHAALALEARTRSERNAELTSSLPGWLSDFEAFVGAPSLDSALVNVPPGALDREVNKDLSLYDREPVDSVSAQVQRVRDVALKDAATPAAYRDALSQLLPANTTASETLRRITEKAVLWVPELLTVPEIDGTVEPAAFSSALATQFHRVHRLQRSAEQTVVLAAVSGKSLYLAFDCAQAAESVGGKLTERDVTGWQNPAMAGDDCVAITFKRATNSTLSVRINCNGAVGSSDPKWDGVQKSAARKTSTGWQAELLIDMEKVGLSVTAKDYALAIARYTRRPQVAVAGKPAEIRIEVSTLLPAPPGEGIIGRGNHPQLMTFLTGPVLRFLPAAR
ncbi:MAG TPA: DUF4838 domain-containing protein [Planctomycetota bacterium]|nr:DUF4838 domain-containing protein [Planctomycetota bacterium]